MLRRMRIAADAVDRRVGCAPPEPSARYCSGPTGAAAHAPCPPPSRLMLRSPSSRSRHLPPPRLARSRRQAKRASPARLALATVASLLTLGACDVPPQIRNACGTIRRPHAGRATACCLQAPPTCCFACAPTPAARMWCRSPRSGTDGLHALRLSGRGWREFDAEYLQTGRTDHAPPARRLGRGGPHVPRHVAARRHAARLAQLPGRDPHRTRVRTGSSDGSFSCRPSPPAGSARRSSTRRHDVAAEIDQGAPERGNARGAVLGHPARGNLSRYQRRVHQIPAGVNGSSSLLVEYNDPSPLPDTVATFGERPRQLIVVLDKGRYGFRPTFTFSTVGTRGTPPRLQFLDYLDLDDDGVPGNPARAARPGAVAAVHDGAALRERRLARGLPVHRQPLRVLGRGPAGRRRLTPRRCPRPARGPRASRRGRPSASGCARCPGTVAKSRVTTSAMRSRSGTRTIATRSHAPETE